MDNLMLRRRVLLGLLSEDYIIFADPVVEQICATNWGDGVGLKPSQAARVTSLGSKFQGNTSITSFNELVYFTGLTGTGGETFYNCTGLVSVTWPEQLHDWSNGFCRECTSLKEFTMGSYVSVEGRNNAFQNTSNLKRLNISSIEDYCKTNWRYNYYPSVSSHEMHLYLIGSNTEITTITVPSTQTVLNNNLFAYCVNITSITVPSTVTEIKQGIFRNCTGLTAIPNISNVTTIGDSAFNGCSNMAGQLTLSPSLTTIGGEAFRGCGGISGTLTLPSSLSSIGNRAFSDCSGITGTLEIPASLTTIPNRNVFAGMGITKVIIPSTMTSIGNYAFYQCSSLSTVAVNATTPPTLGATVFGYNASGRKIYVPYSSDHSILSTYKAASGWSSYASYIYELNQDGTIPT